MRIHLFLIGLIFSSFQFAYSQSYEKLLQERQELLMQLEEAQAQNSALFGKKSKKDLRNTTEILKDIVEKDNEILIAFKKELKRKESPSQSENVEENEQQKIIELESRLATINNQHKQRNIKAAELEQEVATVKDRMFKYQSTILVTILIIFLLTIYISRLRKKAKAMKEISQ